MVETNEFLDRISKLSPKRLALLAMELQTKLDALERPKATEPIAIVGIGCRFPGQADDPEGFWRLLRNGVDAIGEVPPARWDVDSFYDPDPDAPGKTSTRWGGFLGAVDLFDAPFFGIAPREALSLDPQQRLLLEVSWEALERAGQSPDKLAGSATGVFIGIATGDYYQLQLRAGLANVDAYLASGCAHSVAAGRLSYALGLQGPSLAIDTACSSSLVALHLAVQSLRNGECRMALVGGVNLILSPETTIALSKAHMMASDGRCKTFDAHADGFVRGEGCGVVLVKRLADALADGDHVLALIRGSAINQDGRSNGLTAPNGRAQEAVIRAALDNAGVAPGDISYVEAHGTGTALGDPIEVRALGAALCHDRAQPLAIGSVKTNIGHLEAAAGIAGLIKVVLALQHGEIPPHLHLRQPNPYIPWDECPAITIPTEPALWSPANGRRLAGLSSFGFSGTNAHIILEQAPARIAPSATLDRPLHVYTLSARSAPDLDALVARHEEHGRASTDALADQCYTANAGRAHFDHRMAFIAESSGQLHDKLAASRNGQDMAGVLRGKVGNARDGEVVFLFTGQGAQYADMGRQLYETQPSFRTCLEHCDEVLRTYLKTPLLSALYPPHVEAAPLLDETAYTQPALFALEYALATLWQSWGIKPAAVIGHSLGEYVAACVAGVFSLEDGLRLVAERGRLMQQLPRNGEMAAVFADEARARAAIAGYAGQVSVAAVNGPANVVVSGERDAVLSLLGDLSAQGIVARRLNVSHAFHSPLIEPALDALELAVAAVTRAAPQVELVSNLTGDVAAAAQLTDPAYWRRHSRETVRFADSVALLHRQGYAAFLEIGPSTTLSSLGQRCLPDGAAVWLPSLQKGLPNWQTMLTSLGALYARGAAVDWEAFDRDYPRRRVALPTYPFQRERYWVSGELLRPGAFVPPTLECRQAGIDRLLYEVVWQADARPCAAASQDAPEIKPIAERLHSRAAELSARLDMAQYGRMLPELDALCTAYIVAALRKLGYALTRGQQLGVDTLLARLGDAERHRRLIGRLLQILHEDGLLQPAGAGWSVTRTPADADPDQQWEALLRTYPAMSAEITLTGRCARQLSDVLRGDVDPLQLLFPGGTLADAERLYQDSPSSRFYNTLIGEAVNAALARSPRDGAIRILEIGAGTGGTTSAVLPALAGRARPIEYVFTDISPMFTNKAKSKFSRYPFVRYATLDIGRDPLTQGFSEHQFDVIVAANVLHATPDVRQTLANVRRLLAPEGLLVLLEGTSPQRFGDLTVGLTPGWWAFSDTGLRPDYALLPQREWLRLLSDTGLVDAVAVPGEESGDVLSQQAVLMARNPRLEPVEAKAAQGYWLICADQGGIGQGVAKALRAHGQHVVLASAGAAYAQLSDAHFQVDPARPADFEQLLRDARGAGRPACHGAVHLWPLDAHLTEDDDLPAITQAQIHACGSALHLTQALVTLGQSEPPHLWLATRGAQSVSSSSETHPVDANQATVWGLSHVISLEHPELRCTRVDLDAAEGAEASAAFLFGCIWKGAGKEDQVASRGGQRYVRRLARAGRVELTADSPLDFRPDATYLLTGGLGGLGLLVAEWMAQRQARHLALMSRHPPTPADREVVRRIEAMGARVLVIQGDVSQPDQLAGALARVEQEMPPLRGVVHAAGVLDDGVLVRQTWERFRTVMSAKIDGTWNLHVATRDKPLDFFVLFSSGASLLGSAGQANHAAANAFMDAFAYYRQAHGLPAVSINWGAWADVGAAADRKLDARRGIATMAPQEGLQAFEWVVQESARRARLSFAQIAVVPIDWEAVFAQTAPDREPALFKLLSAELKRPSSDAAVAMTANSASGAKQPLPGQAANLLDALKLAPAEDRRDILVERIRQEVAAVLRIDPDHAIDEQQGLFEMGMDSLMSIELKTRLGAAVGHNLPSTLTFNYPTVAALAQYIQSQHPMDEKAPVSALPADAVRPKDDAAPIPDVGNLSENELAELLSAKLTEIRAAAGND